MPDETLLTAARRFVRFFNIDMNKGGLVTVETEIAASALDKQVQAAMAKIKSGQVVTITEDYAEPPLSPPRSPT